MYKELLKMSAIEQLFRYSKIYDQEGSSDLFIHAMRESIIHHENQCSFYKQLLEEANYDVDILKTEEDLAQIPTIPAHFFKYHEITSIDPSAVDIHATSSGTQGQKSQVFLDKHSVRLGTKMIIKAMKYHGLISLMPTNYMLLGYEPRDGNEMGNVKVLLGMMRFAPAVGKTFAIRSVGNDYRIDYFGIIAALKRYAKMRLPVRMLGFPAYLYMLLKLLKDNNMRFNLSNKSVILTGGGWKEYNDQAIDKEELYGLVESVLGIPAENCRDFYSAVEHSVAYPECKNHHMHVPIWSRVIIRDVKTLEPVGYDQPGFLSFISPLVSSMPISSIVMGDMAVLRDGRDCGCGITTPYFEVLGRAGTSKGKSCAMTAAEFMKGGSHGASI